MVRKPGSPMNDTRTAPSSDVPGSRNMKMATKLSPPVFGQLLRLGKPRVVSLIVFTAIIGMFLATPGLPPAQRLLFGSIGIALLATSAAALNCLLVDHYGRVG